LTRNFRSKEFLDAHPSLIQPNLDDFTTGAYLAGDGDSDERAWASAELFEATGQTAYLKDFEKSVKTPTVQAYFDWYGSTNLAYDTYLRSRRSGRDGEIVDKIASAFTTAASAVVERSDVDPYGRGSASYSWGSNGATARLVFTLGAAYFVEPKAEYLDAAQAQIDYLFGRNPFGRSFVTGVGYYPAALPHHRPSSSDEVEAPWPGLLVGGPHSGGLTPPVTIPALKWQDASDDYNHNEIAINWNTALAYALTMVLGAETDPGPCAVLGAGGSCSIDEPTGGLGGLGGSDSNQGGAGGAGG
jgi:endoglucanase